MPRTGNFLASLRCAMAGIIYTAKNERNFKIHLVALAMVIIVAFLKPVSATEAVWLIFAVTTVLVAELVNTAIEKTVDLCTLERRPLAKTAKDVAAGAVLIAALQAVAIGAIVFWP